MNILVTGGAGFLGSWIAEYLVGHGHEVTSVDNYSGGNEVNTIACQAGDVRDLKLMTKLCSGVDTIYHCAALPYEGLSVFSPKVVVSSVVDGTVTVAVAAARNKVKRIVNCSSMARYGVGYSVGYSLVECYRESDECHPTDPYGVAKLCAEQQLNILGVAHGFQVVHAVPHNIVGPRQRYDDPYRNVVSIMANRLLQGLPAIIYGDGSQRRCFSDIRDVLPTFYQMGVDKSITGGVFNVGPDSGDVTIRGLAELIGVEASRNLDPIYVPARPCEVHTALCSSDKIRRQFGFEKKYTIQQTIRSVIAYIQEKGPKPFNYNLEVEIVNDKTPKTWTEKQI